MKHYQIPEIELIALKTIATFTASEDEGGLIDPYGNTPAESDADPSDVV